MKGKRIGVLAGGTSAERDVSLRTGSAIHQALLDLGHDSVFIDASSQVCETLRKEAVDVAFIALHGGVGENGAVQGLLEVMGIPYTGSGVLASALAMDKVASKKLFSFHGLPVAPFIVLQRGISTGHPGTISCPLHPGQSHAGHRPAPRRAVGAGGAATPGAARSR